MRSEGGTEVAGGLGERLGVTVSTPCITQMRPSCGLHVPGGTLHLTKIKFPNGIDEPGEAYATGVINGQVVLSLSSHSPLTLSLLLPPFLPFPLPVLLCFAP